MSVNVEAGAGAGDGYRWPGADEAAVSVACSRIARHLARSGTRVIGILPLADRPQRSRRRRRRVVLAPLLERLADALAGFVGDAEIVHVPGRAGDFGGVAVSAERAARELGWRARTTFRDGAARYVAWHREEGPVAAAPIVFLSDFGLQDEFVGTCHAVVARRVHKRDVAPVVSRIPDGKSLGAILIG